MTAQGEAKYRKLARNIFLASDHLLSRSRSMFRESYKRFYFNEIQYIILQPTAGWHVRSVLLLVLLAACASALAGDDGTTIGTVGVLIAGIGLGMNLMVGPSCRVIMRTALGTQRLYGATTVRRAKKIIHRLNEEITKVQGPLPLQAEATRAPATANTSASNPAAQSMFAGEALGDLASTAANGATVAPGVVPDISASEAGNE
jgi:hypothetical protein